MNDLHIKMPKVIVKIARNSQGIMCDTKQNPIVITHSQTKEWVYQLRSEVDAVLVSTGTVRRDRPHLGLRSVAFAGIKEPLRVAFGRELEFDSENPFFREPQDSYYVYQEESSSFDEAWKRCLKVLARRGIKKILVEAGPEFAQKIFLSAYWDVCYDCIALDSQFESGKKSDFSFSGKLESFEKIEWNGQRDFIFKYLKEIKNG